MIERKHVIMTTAGMTSSHEVLRARLVAECEGAVSRRICQDERDRVKEILFEKMRRLCYGELDENMFQAEQDLVRKLNSAMPFGLADPEPIRETFRNLRKSLQWKKD